jgi:DNA modification methylase
MGKTLEDLKKSRERRQEILDKYGEVPKSIWEIDYSVGKNIIEYEGRKQHNVALEKHKKMDYDKSLHNEFSVSSQNVRGKDGGLSTFPPDLVKRVLQYYTEPFETVLDPCMGHNSRMQATYLLQRNYIGYDVSKEFMEFNREVYTKITEETFSFQEHPFIVLREQSSENLLEEDNSMDLIFTSPPYYNVE